MAIYRYYTANSIKAISGLIAAYNMIPVQGKVLDSSGGNDRGTIYGALSTKDGMMFDGVNDYIDFGINSNLQPTPNQTISMWVKLNTVAQPFQVIFGRIYSGNYGDALISNYAKGYVRLNDNTVFITTNDLFVVNEWIHIAYTFSDSADKLIIYKNGQMFQEWSTTEKHYLGGNTTICIGRYGSSASYHTNGEIKDVRIYNRELTPQEIKGYYNSCIHPVFRDTFSDTAVGNTPIGWNINSGAFVVAEDTTRKYLNCTSSGVISIPYSDTTTGTASIDYYDGSVWTTYTDTLSNLITSLDWLSYTNGFLEFSLTENDRLGNIIIFNGVKI